MQLDKLSLFGAFMSSACITFGLYAIDEGLYGKRENAQLAKEILAIVVILWYINNKRFNGNMYCLNEHNFFRLNFINQLLCIITPFSYYLKLAARYPSYGVFWLVFQSSKSSYNK